MSNNNEQEEETLATHQTTLWLLNDEDLYKATKNRLASRIEQVCRAAWGDKTPEGQPLSDVDWEAVEADCDETEDDDYFDENGRRVEWDD